MTYEELKNTDNYARIGYGVNAKYFQTDSGAMDYIHQNKLPHSFISVWTDEFGYMHETTHTF